MESPPEDCNELVEARIHDETVDYFEDLLKTLPDSDLKQETKDVFNAFFTMRYGQRIKDQKRYYGIYPVTKTDEEGRQYLPQEEIDHIAERLGRLSPPDPEPVDWPDGLDALNARHPMHEVLAFARNQRLEPETTARMVRWTAERELERIFTDRRVVENEPFYITTYE